MRKRILSLILCLTLFIMLVPAAAMAWDGIAAVTLEPGDTVYGICENYGVNYFEAKDVIMYLNGIEEEWQLSALYPGNTILLPVNYDTTSQTATYAAPAPAVQEDVPDDAVLFYVIPYRIHNGDTIESIYNGWGLRFETYAPMIRCLNGVDNLDALTVGVTYYLPTTAENVGGSPYVTIVGHVMRYGENVYNVFYDYGINYYRYKTILWAVNGWRDLDNLNAGEQLLIPVM